ncbi:conjugative transposon protein TraM [Bacteroides heparinolyticus]|uniref:conjugative transposon protein TraM n=1 Tax=Prevotella heparinolytica TaxID=28113 RepID=UPI0035A020B6
MKKPYILGGMLLFASVLFLFTFMDMSDQQPVSEQEVSLRADAEDLSINDMINSVGSNRQRVSHDDIAPGFISTSGNPVNASSSNEDNPETIARIQAAIRENNEMMAAGLKDIEAERNGYPVTGSSTVSAEIPAIPQKEVSRPEIPAKQSEKNSPVRPSGQDADKKPDDTEEVKEEVSSPSPFHSIRLTSSKNKNAIKAYVHSEQIVMAGSTLKMRLGEDAFTDNGVLIPQNSPVYGVVTSIDGERVNVKITHINLSGNILPFKKEVYSKDALLGIYVPGNPKAETSKDVAGGILDGLPTSGIPGVDAAAQIAGAVASSAANAGKQALSKNVKKIKVTIKTNYEIYLRPEEK